MRRWRWLAVVACVAGAVALVAHCETSSERGESGHPDDSANRSGSAGSLRRPRNKLAPEQLASLSGTISDDTGPIPRARVCARGWTDDDRCTTADDHGLYTIAALAPGRYTVAASAEQHTPASAPELALGVDDHRGAVDITLRGGGVEIYGTVTDVSGGPIAHARIAARRDADDARAPSVETDGTGAFRMWLWPGVVDIEATADAYVGNSDIGAAPGRFDFQLALAGSLSGTVIDAATRQPVANAEVAESSGDSRFPTRSRAPLLTDELGHFRIDGLSPGRFGLRAIAPHGYGVLNGSVLVERAREVEGVVIELHPAARLEGHAVLAGAHRRCPGASLVVTRLDDSQVWDSTEPPAADGLLHVDGLVPGTYRVAVRCAGFIGPADVPSFDIGTDDVTGMMWEFADGATIRGRVTSPSGDPVVDAVIIASGPIHADAETHADGGYELRGLTPGRYKLATSSAAGVLPETPPIVVSGHDTVVRDVRLIRGGTISGTVTDATGAAIAGAHILGADQAGYMRTTSDATGHFALANLSAGRGWISAHKDNSHATAVDLDVRASETSTVSLVIEYASGQITGSVVDAAGKPVEDAEVLATLEDTGKTVAPSSTSTLADGQFTLSQLEPGTYNVFAMHPAAGVSDANRVDVGSVARLQLRAMGSIAGRVLGGPGVVTITIGGSRSESFYGTDGAFELDHVAAGHYDLVASNGTSDGHVAIDLAEGEHRTGVDIAVDPGLVISGRVIDLASRQPISGVAVTAGLQAGDARHNATTGPDGRFVMSGVPHGVLTLGTWLAPYASISFGRVAESGASLDVGDVMIAHYRVPFDGIVPLGFSLDGNLRVASVDASDATAGLAVGDALTAIDGIDVTGLPLDFVRPLLWTTAATTTTLTLARGATVTLVGP